MVENFYYFNIFKISYKTLFWSINGFVTFMKESLWIPIYRVFRISAILKPNDILSFFLVIFWWLIPMYPLTRIIKKFNFNIISYSSRSRNYLMPLKQVLKTSHESVITFLTIPQAPYLHHLTS